MNDLGNIPIQVDGVDMNAYRLDASVSTPQDDVATLDIEATILDPSQEQVNVVFDQILEQDL